MSLPNFRYEELSPPLNYLYNGMIDGYSRLCVIVGDETGIGKSRIACRIAELLHWKLYVKKWLPKENVFFSMTEFKEELFNSVGRILIIEEAEIELGSDDWQSISNRWFSRIKDTQRIKGNTYILVLPIFQALAKKHRRRINFMVDVKGRGFGNCFRIYRRSAQIIGDEISKSYLGSLMFSLPDCDKEFDIMDKWNKKRIEKEQGELFDKETKYKKMVEKIKMKKMEKILENDKEEEIKSYTYRCHACKCIFESKKELNEVITCKNCGKRVYIDIQNLVQSPNVKLTNNLNEYENEDND